MQLDVHYPTFKTCGACASPKGEKTTLQLQFLHQLTQDVKLYILQSRDNSVCVCSSYRHVHCRRTL